MEPAKYNIYATLLDAFQDYLDCSETYQEYWGFSDDPAKTEEEYEAEQFQSLIDRINRVPFDSEAADRGTAFNEIVDCIIRKCNSKKCELSSDAETDTITAIYNNRTFIFPRKQTTDYAHRFSGALTQYYTEAIIPTKLGTVNLYGFIDELMPQSIHDIKTTSKYKAGKFRKHWQKIVYPYCLNTQGNRVFEFWYNVVLFNKSHEFNTYDEFYAYVPERDDNKLMEHTEALIRFLESNRHLITDKKIFNQLPK